MNAKEFTEKVGRPPEQDDLERVNCEKAGERGHRNCGWCRACDTPRFMCGHWAPKPKKKTEDCSADNPGEERG